MHKKINMIFILFTISTFISILILLLLRIDNYSKSILINESNQSYIILKQTDFQKMKNQNQIKFKLNKQIYNVDKIQQYYINNYTCIQLYNYFYLSEPITQISTYINSKNIFGF